MQWNKFYKCKNGIIVASCLPHQGNFQSPNWSIHVIYQVWLCEGEVEIQNIQEWTMSAQKETVYPIKFSTTFNQIRCENLSTGDYPNITTFQKQPFCQHFRTSDNKISTNTITYKFNFFFLLFFLYKDNQSDYTLYDQYVSLIWFILMPSP